MVEVGDYALRVRVAGEGPPVILDCGGAGQGLGAWGTALEQALADRATVVTYDRAGVGGSGGRQTGDVTAMADDLHRLVNAMDLPLPATFVGWSFGALVTQVHAARYPDDVAGLVFVDPTVAGTPPGFAFAQRLSFALAPKLLRLRAAFGGGNAQALRELAVTLAGMRQAMAEAEKARAEPGLPRVPIRVITAGKRPRMPRSQLDYLTADHRALAGEAPLGRVVVAEKASHQVPFEQPELIADAVGELLRSTPPEVAG
ncbi:hypothetical protein BAY61_24830 [Prauserella marina]|uniref:Pimeloyl-ACP methyl ester carboxylesterase n=2 Tax=Prauserella marina TaxID=530584 RepID=A0A222VUW7_9PSEU|nr:hypothetical protein BAY61_24830 [Prauserella marina]PWV75623.1 pimeloyl-ACP methyl ester carboxylesterase [Prauserella marina]SDD30319.1 Pimeloyl-ACP methyl ester carboxylesterase [Prauserella marina]